MSDCAKSNYWGLVCRCWKLVSILTFRKGVITDREQKILKIALTCRYEAGSFVVILLECLTRRVKRVELSFGVKRMPHQESKAQSFQWWLGPLDTSLFRCMLKRPEPYWEIALHLMKILRFPRYILRKCGSWDLKSFLNAFSRDV